MDTFSIEIGTGQGIEMRYDWVRIVDLDETGNRNPFEAYVDSDARTQTECILGAFTNWRAGDIDTDLLLAVFGGRASESLSDKSKRRRPQRLITFR